MDKQRVLLIKSYDSDDITSMAYEWKFYDTFNIPLLAAKVDYKSFIERLDSGKYADDTIFYKYPTVIQALVDGWKLLQRDDGGRWWLVR